MNFRHSLLLLALCALPLRAEFPADLATPDYRIVPGENDASWLPLVADLKAKPPLKAVFNENRYFPFRKGPAKLTGEIRLDPVRGLSLHYLTPEDRLMVVDEKGGFMMDERGRRRELPDDPRAQAATKALLNVLRFDLPELAKNFLLYGARDGSSWRFTFVPNPGPLASVLNPITVTGDNGLVKTIEMRKAAAQRVEILIGETKTGVTFNEAELTKFFR
ncbi:hypothetical protein [Rariglobus hedericola]|uniref:Outer membrane lipoprotein carrier protein LolA n=1 Tax=Rariglobus hedericola TaxID=2597822 RepID=A0A556QN97_9BACT|nr:hypothetical protein [Rariglobus hedericola]TSJ78104.1 hypothetical protein FPL22_01980 [Rariglobus hedericola]